MEKKWYKEGFVYQIYPLSFCDSNNDGIGDLKGITSKLDYIKSLGVSVIWLSPVYKSPMYDNGYDISDYYDINPIFGDMDDFKELLSETHKRGLKLIMDLVVNHTSSEHEWFKKSIEGIEPYKDYYIWREKPNNWSSFFAGPAWDYSSERKMYYLHLFAKQQPDLNWENEKVRDEVKNVLRFWLDMGVDGFRCDVINLLSKKEGLPNGRGLFLRGKEHFINGPKIHEYLKELKHEVLDNYDAFTVGESCFVTTKTAIPYIKEGEEELNMLFQFDHMGVDNLLKWFFHHKAKLSKLKKALRNWQEEINGVGWNTLYFENHDQPRSVSRFGNLNYRYESATMLAIMLFHEQGTPYIYQGQEIGMTNPNFDLLDDYKDVETHNIYKTGTKTLHFSHKKMMKKIKFMSRDNARTPMQWNDCLNAGFSDFNPWIKVNPNYKEINVSSDLKSDKSIIRFYQKMINLRKEYPIIVYGDFKEYKKCSNKIVYYERNYKGDKLIVLCNYSSKERKIKAKLDNAELLLNNYEESTEIFKPYQAKVYIIKGEKNE